MDKRRSISQFLETHAAEKGVSFHMPGHKGSRIYRENGCGGFLDAAMDWDITEIPGADNLFQPEDIIRETMNRYKAIYGVRESYLLINGSSAGLIAAVMAAVPQGGKLIMARNCHKSVFNAVSMINGEPVYAYPELIDDYGISGEITAAEIQRCLLEHPDARAVLLTSPNYYGVCSDIAAISEIVHRAGKILIVDQAHGAHLKFFDAYINEKNLSAENQGADIVINSTHKTLASFTQTAVANLCGGRVDKYVFEDKLQLVESTSPSYLLMASLDINADLLERKGRQLIEDWEENLRYFYGKAAEIQSLRVMKHAMLDHTKMNLDMSGCGFSGLELEEFLMERGIFVELVTGNILMCMSGIGNRRCDYERLLEALREAAALGKGPLPEAAKPQTLTMKRLEQRAVPMEKERIPLGEAAGRICGVSIIPYPPGIPIICPGEVIDEEVLSNVSCLREKGEKVMGIDDLGRVVAGKE